MEGRVPVTIKSERERLERVYRGYEEDAGKQFAWDSGNPGNAAILRERRSALRKALASYKLQEMEILEIGCGGGGVLAGLRTLGARDERLHGVDILEHRVAEASKHYPTIDIRTADATQLPFQQSSMNIALIFTVFSSILDAGVRERVATEVNRVLSPDGIVVWYDFRYNNPSNENVRGMKKNDIRKLFPRYIQELKTITLLPPLARRLGMFTGILYPMLVTVPFLRTHYFGLLRKGK